MTILSPFASGAVNVDLDMTTVAQLVLFTAFVVLMKDMIFDPLLRVFEERERRTAGAIDLARGADDRAIQLKEELDGRIEEVRRDAALDRDKIRTRLKKLESATTAEARAAADEKLEAGLTQLKGEAQAVEVELSRERTGLAAQIASRVLGREVES